MAPKPKKVRKVGTDVLAVLDELITTMSGSKDLDYKEISLERGSFVGGSISFGSLALDLVTGGGCPPARWTTAYGQSGSGKSTLVYSTIANAMGMGIPVLFYDAESGTDGAYLRNLGVHFTDPVTGKKNPLFRYFQPNNGTQTYQHMSRIIRALPDWVADEDTGDRPQAQILMVMDSLDAFVSGAQAEADGDDKRRGLQASLHSEGMRLIKSVMGRKNVSVLATNQIRTNPGVSFGDPNYQPGGNAVIFYPDLTIRLTAVGKPFSERGFECRHTNVKTMKNKLFVPFRELKEDLGTAPVLAFGRGFERGHDGLAYLRLTDQIIDPGKRTKSAKYQLNVDGKKRWSGLDVSYEELIVIMCSNKFREHARAQLVDGTAFTKYFENQKINMSGSMDPEDPGSIENLEAKAKADEVEAELQSTERKRIKKLKAKGEKIDPETGEILIDLGP